MPSTEDHKLSLVSGYDESERAFAHFKDVIGRKANLRSQASVGWAAGSVVDELFWFAEHGFWCLPRRTHPKDEERKSHWICFGTGKPDEAAQHSIVVEINPPYAGAGRRTAGAFLTEANGKLFIAHSGKIGGARKGRTRAAFITACSIESRVHVPQRRQEMFVFGPIDDDGWLATLGAYVHDVAAFKKRFEAKPVGR